MKEIWKDVPQYEGLYQASNLGRIKSLQRKKHIILKSRTSLHDPYETVYLFSKLRKESMKITKVHRLVAITFILNPFNKKYVNHINGIKTDNKLENLEWISASENQKHKFEVLGHKYPCKDRFGKDNTRSKSVIQMTLDNDFIAEYEGVHDAARKTGFNRGAIGNCCRNIANKHKNYKWKFK